MPVVNPSLYRVIPGGARRYVDLATGQSVSRRQAIKGSTGQTIEQRVKATPKELRLSRPARGRPKAHYEPSSNASSRLRPLRGHIARRISAGSTAASYDRVLAGLRRNPTVDGISVLAVLDVAGAEKFVWLTPLMPKDEIMTGREAAAIVGLKGEERDDDFDEDQDEQFTSENGLLMSLSYAGAQFMNFAFHVHFDKSAYRPPAPKAAKKRTTRKVMAAVRDTKGKPVKTASGRVKLRKRKSLAKKK
jgi:hypothetical protein